METLELGRRFPVVVLASNFVNHPDRRGATRVPRLLRETRPDPTGKSSCRASRATGRRARIGRARCRSRFGSGVLRVDEELVSGEMEYLVDGERALARVRVEAARATRSWTRTSSCRPPPRARARRSWLMDRSTRRSLLDSDNGRRAQDRDPRRRADRRGARLRAPLLGVADARGDRRDLAPRGARRRAPRALRDRGHALEPRRGGRARRSS